MKYRRIRFCLFAYTIMAILSINSCAVSKSGKPSHTRFKGPYARFHAGQIIHVKTGKAISFDRFIDQLGAMDLIFIGEVHDNPEHHLIQVQILQALKTRFGPLTVAMEFFPKPRQSMIDRYMQGTTTEDQFLKDVNWNNGWAFDYLFYRPLILLIKEDGGDLLAINAPGNIVKKVARSGLDSLDRNEKNQIAENIDLSNKSHRAFLKKIFDKHEHQDLKNFDYFYQAQCVWEDTMAENIASSLIDNKKKMVVLLGNGHIVNGFGVPERTLKRTNVSMAEVVTYPLPGHLVQEEADYIWLTGNCSRRHHMIHNMPPVMRKQKQHAVFDLKAPEK